MKNIAPLVVLLVLSHFSFAQSSAEDYIRKGVDQHEMGSYENAIASYQKALEINPGMPLAHYEMALTYMYMKNYEKTAYHSEQVLKTKNDFHLQAYLAKGSAEDNLGKPLQAIKTYKKGIKKYNGNSLLHYNRGLTYFNLKKNEKCEEEIVRAVQLNPNHSSSHLLLSNLAIKNRKKIKSILSSAYFLTLEPTSKRSKYAYKDFFYQFYGNVSKDKDKPNSINIFVNPDDKDSEFGASEMFLPLMIASNMGDTNSEKSREELLPINFETLIGILSEKEKGKKQSFYGKFYVPFYKNLKEEKLVRAFCAHISQGADANAKNWIKNNAEEYKVFLGWLKSQKIVVK